MESGMALGPGSNNFLLGVLLATLVAVGVLAYLYYERTRPIAKIDVSEDCDVNGIGVIEKVRNDRPHEYRKIVAAVLPKQMQREDLTPSRKAEDLTDDELACIATGNA